MNKKEYMIPAERVVVLERKSPLMLGGSQGGDTGGGDVTPPVVGGARNFSDDFNDFEDEFENE